MARAPSRTVTPSSPSSLGGLRRELLAERGHARGRRRRAGSPAPGSVSMRGTRASWSLAVSASSPATSTPVGPAADDDEGQPLGLLGRVVAALGLLEAPIEALREVDRVGERLQPARDLLPLVVAEVGRLARRRPRSGCRSRAGRRGRARPAGAPASTSVTSAISTRGVGAALERGPDRRGAVARGQGAGRDLVEQRLEQVVVRAVDQRHVDVGAPRARARAASAAEAAADDHDRGAGRRRRQPARAGSCAAARAPSRSSRWSPTRSALAIAVSAGFTAPMLGKKLVSTT